MSRRRQPTAKELSRLQRELHLHIRRNLLEKELKIPQWKDPFVEVFGDDPVICEVRTSPQKMCMGRCNDYCWTALVHFYLLPCRVVCCPLLMFMDFAFPKTYLNHLILRENTLVYKFEGGKMLTSMPGSPPLLDDSNLDMHSMEIVIPLDQDIHFEVMPSNKSYCGNAYYPVQTLVLKVGSNVIGSIDGPTETTSFIEAVKRQREIVASNKLSIQVPSKISEVHNALIAQLSAINGLDGLDLQESGCSFQEVKEFSEKYRGILMPSDATAPMSGEMSRDYL